MHIRIFSNVMISACRWLYQIKNKLPKLKSPRNCIEIYFGTFIIYEFLSPPAGLSLSKLQQWKGHLVFFLFFLFLSSLPPLPIPSSSLPWVWSCMCVCICTKFPGNQLFFPWNMSITKSLKITNEMQNKIYRKQQTWLRPR